MSEIITVSNLINAIALLVAWSIKQELWHIRMGIEDAKNTANEAHKRIDGILAN